MDHDHQTTVVLAPGVTIEEIEAVITAKIGSLDGIAISLREEIVELASDDPDNSRLRAAADALLALKR